MKSVKELQSFQSYLCLLSNLRDQGSPKPGQKDYFYQSESKTSLENKDEIRRVSFLCSSSLLEQFHPQPKALGFPQLPLPVFPECRLVAPWLEADWESQLWCNLRDLQRIFSVFWPLCRAESWGAGKNIWRYICNGALAFLVRAPASRAGIPGSRPTRSENELWWCGPGRGC